MPDADAAEAPLLMHQGVYAREYRAVVFGESDSLVVRPAESEQRLNGTFSHTVSGILVPPGTYGLLAGLYAHFETSAAWGAVHLLCDERFGRSLLTHAEFGEFTLEDFRGGTGAAVRTLGPDTAVVASRVELAHAFTGDGFITVVGQSGGPAGHASIELMTPEGKQSKKMGWPERAAQAEKGFRDGAILYSALSAGQTATAAYEGADLQGHVRLWTMEWPEGALDAAPSPS